jgi:septin family protein
MNDEFARMIYDKYKNGFLNAFSIGFQALEKDGDTFTKSELLEISAVPVPANPEALTILREAKIEAVDWKKFFEEKGLTSQNIMKEDEEEDKKEEKTEDEEVKPEDQDKKTIAEMQTKINDLEKQIKDLKEDKKNLKALRDSMKILVTVSNLALNRINEQSRGGE